MVLSSLVRCTSTAVYYLTSTRATVGVTGAKFVILRRLICSTRYIQDAAKTGNSASDATKIDGQSLGAAEGISPETSAAKASHIECGETSAEARADDGLLHTADNLEAAHSGTLWFSNLFPIQASRFDPRLRLFDKQHVLDKLGTMIDRMGTHDIHVTDVRPLKREGGAYVDITTAKKMSEASTMIVEYLTKTRDNSLLLREHIRCDLVLGHPFVHDIEDVFAADKVKITIHAGEREYLHASNNQAGLVADTSEPLDLTIVYDLLRPYGKIKRLKTLTSASANSSALLTVIATYTNISAATAAKNSLQGMRAGKLRRRVTVAYYGSEEANSQKNSWWPRLMAGGILYIPMLLSLIIYTIVQLFEPVREFCIINKITRRFALPKALRIQNGSSSAENDDAHIQLQPAEVDNADFNKEELEKSLQALYFEVQNKVLAGAREVMQKLSDSAFEKLGLADHPLGTGAILWSLETYKQVEDALTKGQRDAVVCLAGPRDSGRTTLLMDVLKDTPNILHINLHRQDTVNGNMPLLAKLVEDTGYFPALMGVFELRQAQEQMLAVASRGVVAPTTTELTQTRKVLDTVSNALHSIAEKRMHIDDASEKSDAIPVVIINGLSSVLRTEHPEFCDLIVDWVATLVYDEIANSVIITDGTVVEELNESGKGPYDIIRLQDSPIEKSLDYLRTELPPTSYNEDDLNVAALLLGGRLEDLRELVRRVQQNGCDLNVATNDMLAKAVGHLRKVGLGIGTLAASDDWSQVQAWSVFAGLALEKEIPHDQILFSQFFNGNEAGLRGMDRAGLISMIRETDATGTSKLMIKAGRPLLQAAFTKLVNDRTLAVEMEIKLADFLIEIEQKSIKEKEEELHLLSDLVGKVASRDGGLRQQSQSMWNWLWSNNSANDHDPTFVSWAASLESLYGRIRFLSKSVAKSSEKIVVTTAYREALVLESRFAPGSRLGSEHLAQEHYFD